MEKRATDWRRARTALDVSAYFALGLLLVLQPRFVPLVGAFFIATLYFTKKH